MTVQAPPFALHPDRLFPADTVTRDIARQLYATVKDLPIISPHGHTDPRWFAENAPFPDPARLFIVAGPLRPPHALQPGHPPRGARRAADRRRPVESDPREIWRLFAANSISSAARRRGCGWTTPSPTSSASTERLTAENADRIYDHIAAAPDAGRSSGRAPSSSVSTSKCWPRPIARSTTCAGTRRSAQRLEGPRHHRVPSRSGGRSRSFPAFADNIERAGRAHRRGHRDLAGYLAALADRRAYFKEMGATSTDHGHPTARTADLSPAEAAAALRPASSGGTACADGRGESSAPRC